MSSREEFNEWFANQFWGECYADVKDHLFSAWKASREALVIELPEPFAVIGDYAACGGGKAVWDLDYSEKIDDRMCKKTSVYDRACLEAAGLKVKS
ncbi:hypothetical protein OKW98_18565 [Pseudomonas sp. KU26590]|uniref:hypothetical protein n=1 Tax=Pseudomonas sp. KU26590 TaxID=2991051 RepID=UPI00223DF91D|nr:hypothetical protein [Pseudomonas sp. KU26590]UZJ58581.1 hypothetical protein OKW98_18565 [Pseudomonas sp. KU26590]